MKRIFFLIPLIVIALVISESDTFVSAQPATKRIEITAKRFEYLPGEITLKKGEPVTLVVKSVDVAHGLKFPELNLDTKVGKGDTGLISFTPEKTGDFVGRCSVFCGARHGSMRLTIHVVE